MKWTDYRLSKLKEMWDNGHKAIEIAEVLGTTKNSIIGKANRINCTPRKRGGLLGIKKSRMLIEYKTQKSIPLINEPENPTTLEDLTDDICRFPLGNDCPPKLFCGRKTWEDQSYCKKHYKLTHVERDPDIGCTLGGKTYAKNN